MGFLGNLFGKSAKARPAARGMYRTCDVDGKPIQVMAQNMSIFTNTPDQWSIENMAGYCPQCRRYLCSDHLEFRNTTGDSFGPWEIGCKSCHVSVRPGP